MTTVNALRELQTTGEVLNPRERLELARIFALISIARPLSDTAAVHRGPGAA